MASIEDLLTKAYHRDIREHGNNIQMAIEGVRLDLLAKHYAASLPEDKRTEWNGLSAMEKQVRLAKNEYKLPGDFADRFMDDIAYSIMHGVDPKKAEAMKKQIAILNDPNATIDQKRDAHKEMDHFKSIIKASYDIDLDKLEAQGKDGGFGPGLFRAIVKDYGETYQQKEASFYTKQIDAKMANDYLAKVPGSHADLAKFNVKLATSDDTPVDEKRALVGMHYEASKNAPEGAYKDFMKNRLVKKYFK
ncbi:hypothetical protein JXB28_01485 [Candidatus Woesearchaeota archaeon]|nr:hypothetical protein [Candidatus Woesearchaeota archaeon]